MSSNNSVEHFITLFDAKFLPMGLALHESLLTHGQPFHLWILCMDEQVEEQLEQLLLPQVTLIPVKTIETRQLLEVKPGRTCGEYCWTLTPFVFHAVFEREASVERVTYLDADLFFFDDPRTLLRELDGSGKHVLITEHAYAPEYRPKSLLNGKFCVQFMTFRRTAQSEKVLQWWQERCLEWCFDRMEEGKFGDQKYLDSWPELFSEEVHIIRQMEKTLAPWNVRHFGKLAQGELAPVFYHFHRLRIVGPDTVQLYRDYNVGRKGTRLYDVYIAALRNSFRLMKGFSMTIPYEKDTELLKDKIYRIMHGRRARKVRIKA